LPPRANPPAEGTTAIFHCVNVPLTEHEQLIDAAQNVLDAAGASQAHVVFPGNTWVFGGPEELPITPDTPRHPPSEIAEIKDEVCQMVLDGGGTVVYLPDFFGPVVLNELVRPLFEAALAGKNATFPGPVDVPHEFIYIDDAARALTAVAGQPAAFGKRYTVPGLAIVTVREFGQLIYRAAGTQGEVRPMSPWLLRFASWFDGRARAGVQVLHVFASDVRMDGSQIKAEFGYEPRVSYEEGIQQTLAWFRERKG
jgi:nucleoside-diphosphate-sugar epimerase